MKSILKSVKLDVMRILFVIRKFEFLTLLKAASHITKLGNIQSYKYGS